MPQHPAIQYPIHSIWQTPSQPHQKQSSTSQPPSSEPIEDVQQQSRQIHRILSCRKDAYFDILSLANGTDMPVVIEASWHNLSWLVNPVGCRLPNAKLAFSRVHDAYAWIRAHPGLPQPYIPPQTPPVTQDTPSTPRESLAASSPGIDTSTEPQQSKSGSRRRFATPPSRRCSPKSSSDIYVTNGKPFARPVEGWQFRDFRGEKRVWYNGRWRRLIQNRRDFQGLRVNKHGWIMPIFNRTLSLSQWRTVQEQAKVEFNSHT